MITLVPTITDTSSAPLESIREGIGEGLLIAGRADRRVVVLCADLTESIKLESFAKELPDQFIEVGVAEQNMLGIAAGLALAGKIPFVASYAAFNPGRNWDQLRVSVAYSQANVRVIGSHAGLNVGPDGATHQALEDIAITRVLPGMTVIAPTDREEAKKVVAASIGHVGPLYIRFPRSNSHTVTTPETPFKIGTANLLRKGSDVTICATGPLVYESLMAAAVLKKEGVSAAVIAVPTIKPLDEDQILALVKKTGAVVTAEEAQVTGGLGGAIAELLGERLPAPMQRVGVIDRFGESGTSEELLSAYGLQSHTIVSAVHEVIRRKKLS